MARGQKSGGREKGTPNKKKAPTDQLTKLLKDYGEEAVLRGFKKARRTVGDKKTIIEHLCEKAFTDNSLAQFMIKFIMSQKKPSEAPATHKDDAWANKTPSEVCEEMDRLTMGKKTHKR